MRLFAKTSTARCSGRRGGVLLHSPLLFALQVSISNALRGVSRKLLDSSLREGPQRRAHDLNHVLSGVVWARARRLVYAKIEGAAAAPRACARRMFRMTRFVRRGQRHGPIYTRIRPRWHVSVAEGAISLHRAVS